jgi:N-acetyl-1-D-myo-inositol-2-amino-2-deoxy-alpha-D-glucopyranoside deacetylase
MTAPRRLLFVHAHPDDETLATGVTMAHYARAGHEVHLLTCTLGEEGEVIPPGLRHLAADRDDALGPHRHEELREAMRRLGVQFAVLGEDRARGVLSRYRDSGMAGTPSADRVDAFARAAVDEAADLVARHVRRVRPDVVVTYDRGGSYGHPDHIQAHVVTFRALGLLADEERPTAAYVVVTPRSWAHEDRTWLASHVPAGSGLAVPSLDDPYHVSVVPDDHVTHVVVDSSVSALVAEAMAAHSTQVSVFGDHFCLSNLVAARVPGREAFMEVQPLSGEPLSGGSAGRWRNGLLGLDEGMLT